MKNFVLSLTLASVALAGCSSNPYTGEDKLSNTALGVGTGAAIGAAAGALLGQTTSLKTRKAALIGAGLGALAGGGAGAYMDRQEAKLRAQLRGSGVSVTRRGDNIILNMPSNITFDKDRAEVKPQFYNTLESVGLVLAEYSQTYIDVTGHTDSDGADDYNFDLSRRRAASVAQYLVSQQINQDRFSVEGRGEGEPIAPNNTASGKAQNRRVEITLQPIT
jgi:outer membrane protein OmpA-like peptidoglycan-associated protein